MTAGPSASNAERPLLIEQLRNEWRARVNAIPIDVVMTFRPDGLVLGAGTVLAPANGECADWSSGTDEADVRLSTLLSVAYGRSVADEAVGHVRRAARRWNEGETSLASLHLALARLDRLSPPNEAARRLFMADALMKAGVESRTILEAFDADGAATEATLKYSETQPRVPKGSGRTSGQWTRIGAWLADLSEAALSHLGRWGAALAAEAGPAGALGLGLAFIPFPNGVRVEGKVQGAPGLSYVWNKDEPGLTLTYDGPDGRQRVVGAKLDDQGVVRDNQGRVIGRVLPGDVVVINSAAAISDELSNKDEPNLCPSPTPDRPGRGVDKDRDYEDFVKQVVNPGNPTPRGFGVSLPNPAQGGNLVVYDDCQRSTGTMIEAKGTGYAKPIDEETPGLFGGMTTRMLDQGKRQIEASGGRRVRWYFEEQQAANYVKALFGNAKDGQAQIQIVVLPAIPASK